ncbi:monooxygenase [Streptomyces venezuelae ATCC 10712]|uniref:Monooxygenase n=1 Tax=Streptomyces venezuelae (strain ATCC 10712 / CBS 650.69 / DSM 40230 / JCM 4526 / NBRC 13096 / PD 04745) TaxID=953739 RepID=F2R6T5_STRVP|nr:monooxygenase [Streptomyces venezuelae ATCC 10712]
MDPVIIVGAGPVGLALSLALAAQSVPSVVLDEGPGKEEPRPARSVVLRADMAAMVERLGCTTLRDEGVRWVGWRGMRRRQVVRHLALDLGLGGTEEWSEDPAAPATPAAPLHIPQHALARGLRDAIARQKLIRLVTDARLDTVEQDRDGVVAHTRGPAGTWWRGSHLVGCDGARSTVRKLLGIRFPGRTAVERHAVAALRTELPWPGEALLHRQPPWRGAADEITARPLPDGVWRIDWLLPPRGDLVTPDALIARIRETLAGWCEGTTPPYELIDTGVHTLHHRLARRWRVDRVLLAGDAAHLLGAVGTQGLDEGFRDVDNLAWKLAHTWHHGGSDRLLDSYQSERRAAVAHRLRAADQSLPVLRGGGGLRTYLPGATRGHDALLTDGHVGRGPLGAPPAYPHSPLAPPYTGGRTPVGTPEGAPVEDVRVTAPDGTTVRLRDRLGQGRFLVLLIAPGTGVWDRRHWRGAGVMPRLDEAVRALPAKAEVLVTEAYPGAPAHAVLLVRPDGHLVAAFAGVHPAELYAAADAARGGTTEATAPTGPAAGRKRPGPGRALEAGSGVGSDTGSGVGSDTGSAVGPAVGTTTGSTIGSDTGADSRSVVGPDTGTDSGADSGADRRSSTGSDTGSAVGPDRASDSGSAVGPSSASDTGSAVGPNSVSGSGSESGSGVGAESGPAVGSAVEVSTGSDRTADIH